MAVQRSYTDALGRRRHAPQATIRALEQVIAGDAPGASGETVVLGAAVRPRWGPRSCGWRTARR